MKRIIIFIVVVMILNSCDTFNKKQTSQTVDNSSNIQTEYPLRAINKNPESNGFPDTLNFIIDGIDYRIYPNGYIYWGKSTLDSVKLTTNMYVSQSFYCKRDSMLFLFCEESDSDNGTSEIFKINLSNKQLMWRTEMIGFNLGKPVLRGNFAYLTTIGIVGKLDLIDGKYVYQFSNLYDNKKYSFNNFDTITFQDNFTTFISKNDKTNQKESVIVNEETKTIQLQK